MQASDGKGAKTSYGVSDDFEALDTVISPFQQERMDATTRASLPQMLEGDQFAIEDLQRLPNAAAPQSTAPQSAAPQPYTAQTYGTQSYNAPGSAGFAGTDADLATVVPSIIDEDDIADISSVELPDTITALLAQSAQKLNDGLRGKGAGGR